MTNDQIKQNVENGINTLLEKDPYLIQNNVSERAITHKLAEHIQKEFPKYHVDCEYNRYKKIEKFIGVSPHALSERLIKLYKERLEHLQFDLLPLSTYPDIIVHKRGGNKHNLVILEVKKLHGEPEDLDILKLKAFTETLVNPYRYQLGVSIIFKTNREKTESFEIEYPTLKWFENGEESD